MENILKLKRSKIIKICVEQSNLVFIDEVKSSSDTFSFEEENIELKTYLNIIKSDDVLFTVYLKPELVREDVFYFDRSYEKHAKKISYWEIIKKYNCEVEEIEIAQRVIVESERLKVECYSIKQELLYKLKSIFEKDFNKIIKLCPQNNENIDFFKIGNKFATKLNSAVTFVLAVILILSISNIYVLAKEKKKLKMTLNNANENILTNNAENKAKLAFEKRKAVKRIENIITALGRISKIMGNNVWLDEYSIFHNEEKIKGFIKGDYSELINKMKKEYEDKTIKIEALKNEGDNINSFCFIVKTK